MNIYDNPNRKKICASKLKRYIKLTPYVKTQEKFAELMDVNVRTVKRWVLEGVDSLTTIKEIADCLGISDLDLLLDESGELPSKNLEIV